MKSGAGIFLGVVLLLVVVYAARPPPTLIPTTIEDGHYAGSGWSGEWDTNCTDCEMLFNAVSNLPVPEYFISRNESGQTLFYIQYGDCSCSFSYHAPNPIVVDTFNGTVINWSNNTTLNNNSWYHSNGSWNVSGGQ